MSTPEVATIPASADAGRSWIGSARVSLRRRRRALASLQAAVRHSLAFTPTLLVQVSASFIGRLTPEGLGWLVLNQRYLERAGVERVTAAGAIGLKVFAGVIARVAVMAVVAALVGASDLIRVELT